MDIEFVSETEAAGSTGALAILAFEGATGEGAGAAVDGEAGGIVAHAGAAGRF